MTREQRNAYMREWNTKNRDHLRAQRQAKVRQWRQEPASEKPCSSCGAMFLLTPNARSIRTTKCNRCRTLKTRAERQRRQRAKHPERNRAYAQVGYALKTGKLRRQPCERCGSANVHAHHDDYSKPLEVRWLCRDCHETLHHPERSIA